MCSHAYPDDHPSHTRCHPMSKVIADWHPIEPLAIHQPPAMLPDRQDAVAKGSQRSTGDNSTMTPRIFRVGEPDAQRDDGLSVTEIVGTVAKPPLTEREQRLQDMGNQIGRAIDRLSQHEHRLGCHEWRP
jgi:hypothetical protein